MWVCPPKWFSASQSFDLRTTPGQLVFQAFEAAVEVVDAVDDGFALGREAGNDQ